VAGSQESGVVESGVSDITISPDGTRAAYTIEEQGSADVWTLDLARSVRTRFTFGPQQNDMPKWAPSGKEIAFASFQKGHRYIHVQPVDGRSAPKMVTRSPSSDYPQAWSPDAMTLLFARRMPQTGIDLWTLRRQADGSFTEPSVWLQSTFDEYNATFSPNGRFVLYTSTESGHAEVYVRSYPDGGDKRRISSSGGDFAHWSRDGREIFYVHGSALFASQIAPDAAPIGAARELFRTPVLEATFTRYPYDVSPDGKRFLIGEAVDAAAAKPPAIHVVMNWPALLRQNARETK
jgi:Tol biopolymer transport system component